MRIAVVGPLGLPATYGGVSRHCEELYSRLASRGHEVTVFCRSYYTPQEGTYRGIRLERVPVVRAPGWETLQYGLTSSIRSMRGRWDLVHYQGITTAGFCLLPGLRGRRLALTVHSRDWAHGKWGPLPRALLRASEAAAVRRAAVVIAVSRTLRDELEQRYPGARVHYVPNGVSSPAPGGRAPAEALAPLGLVPGNYVLYVGRLVPEKGVDVLVRAFAKLGDTVGDLAVVGGARHSEDFERRLRSEAGPHVRFLGVQTGDALAALYAHARAFVAPSFHEGLPLTLLEAISYGLPVVATDIAAHREVLGPDARLVPPGDVGAIAGALRDPGPPPPPELLRPYDWDLVAARTEELIIGSSA